jgi:hypothetical protein
VKDFISWPTALFHRSLGNASGGENHRMIWPQAIFKGALGLNMAFGQTVCSYLGS